MPVQNNPSSHEFASFGVFRQPATGSQVSSVHSLPSSHSALLAQPPHSFDASLHGRSLQGSTPAAHNPDTHISSPLQNNPSSQSASAEQSKSVLLCGVAVKSWPTWSAVTEVKERSAGENVYATFCGVTVPDQLSGTYTVNAPVKLVTSVVPPALANTATPGDVCSLIVRHDAGNRRKHRDRLRQASRAGALTAHNDPADRKGQRNRMYAAR